MFKVEVFVEMMKILKGFKNVYDRFVFSILICLGLSNEFRFFGKFVIEKWKWILLFKGALSGVFVHVVGISNYYGIIVKFYQI